jgi:hypothetical protein
MDEPTSAPPQDTPAKDVLSQNGIVDNNNANCTINLQKLSPYDTAALMVKKAQPHLTPGQVANILVKNGVSENKKTMYVRLSKNSYLRSEFQQLEKQLREQLVREEYPLARKAIRKILKDKDNKIPPNAQVAAAKIIYDKVHADKQDAPGSPVSIGNIERLQVLVSSDVSHITSDKQG